MIDMRSLTLVMAATTLAAQCPDSSEAGLPSASDVAGYYASDRGLEATVNGNVATIYVAQSAQQLRRGGALWAKVGPYVFLFTDETQQLLTDYPGLAGVRVVTRVGEAEVANALLLRNELNDVLWRRAKNIAGQARRDGTERVRLLEELVAWGEAHTEFEYNSRYTRR